MAAEVVLTPEGKVRLEHELERLRGSGRAEVAERLRKALEIASDLIENDEYLDAKEDQARLEQRIAALEDRLGCAVVVARGRRSTTVDVGAHVRLRDRETHRIEEYDVVGTGEGDPASGRISRDSPVGSALLGHDQGDAVEIDTPAGVRTLTILAVR